MSIISYAQNFEDVMLWRIQQLLSRNEVADLSVAS